MSFNQAEYDGILDEIEKYLGYLKGNELTFAYFLDVERAYQSQGVNFGKTSGDYVTPCPDAQYRFEPHYALPFLGDGGPRLDFEHEQDILAGATQSWENGPPWAKGIADQVRGLTAQITAPDAGAIADAARQLALAVLWLEQVVFTPKREEIGLDGDDLLITGDWADLDKTVATWNGSAAEEFSALYQKLGATLHNHWFHCGSAAAQAASAATVVSSTQRGVMRTAREIRDQLKAQLTKWQETRQPPSDGSEFPSWILDLIAVGKLIKAARLAYKVLKTPQHFEDHVRNLIIDTGKDIGKEAGKEAAGAGSVGKEEPFKAADAEEILRSILDNFGDHYRDEFQPALDMVGDFSMVDELNGAGDGVKFPPVVPEDGTLAGPADSYPG